MSDFNAYDKMRPAIVMAALIKGWRVPRDSNEKFICPTCGYDLWPVVDFADHSNRVWTCGECTFNVLGLPNPEHQQP